jgi:hypothetical protein
MHATKSYASSACRAEIDASCDPGAKMEEVIDPRDTRRLLCEFANLAAPLRTPGPSAFTMRP